MINMNIISATENAANLNTVVASKYVNHGLWINL
jgi:hypothetical protein